MKEEYLKKYEDEGVYGLPVDRVLAKPEKPSESKTHLGNKRLHKNKSVMIEGGQVPRARVMDQCIIDRYLMRGLLDLKQHQAGEFILKQASIAKAWPTGVDWSGSMAGGGKRNNVPFGVFPLGQTLSAIEDRYGWFHMYVTSEVTIHDWDVSANEFMLDCLREGLNWVADRRMVGRPDPLGRLKRLRKNA